MGNQTTFGGPKNQPPMNKQELSKKHWVWDMYLEVNASPFKERSRHIPGICPFFGLPTKRRSGEISERFFSFPLPALILYARQWEQPCVSR